MVVSAHCEHAEQIDSQTQATDEKELTCIHLWWIQSVGHKSDIMIRARRNARTHSRWMASKIINTDIRMRNIPFAKPESVSMRP